MSVVLSCVTLALLRLTVDTWRIESFEDKFDMRPKTFGNYNYATDVVCLPVHDYA